MSERLRSVGLDVGTTTTQLIVSELHIHNRASSFAVPEMEITDRKILYKSPVQFTPLLDDAHVNGAAIRDIVTAEYEKAGIRRSDIDTGAIIITGETARKENARTVLDALSDFAGEFVVATAGPDLESILAAKGAGAVDYAERTGKMVLHFDIGGGTSNWSLIQDGRILETGCLNVGGRLLKFAPDGTVTYISPVLDGLWHGALGEKPREEQVEGLCKLLSQALEMCAGLRQSTELLEKLTTSGVGQVCASAPAGTVLSFSGGVADCIETEHPWLAFGDMGPLLGKAIRQSRLCAGAYVLGRETIRATVIGAGCHSAQLSGSTVFLRNARLPLKNLPVARISAEEQQSADLPGFIARRLDALDGDGVLALPGLNGPTYRELTALAEGIIAGLRGRPIRVAVEADMAKALGQIIALRCPGEPVLCIDRVKFEEGSYLDIAVPIGPAVPIVVKTLVLAN